MDSKARCKVHSTDGTIMGFPATCPEHNSVFRCANLDGPFRASVFYDTQQKTGFRSDKQHTFKGSQTS
jgi:hypothetical protein